MLRKMLAVVVACGLMGYIPARAQTPAAPLQLIADDLAQSADGRAVVAVFSHFLSLSVPRDLQPAYQSSDAKNYLREWVPKGETVHAWSQMFTIRAFRNLAANPRATPQAMAMSMMSVYRMVCPQTYSSADLGEFNIEGGSAVAHVHGCGALVKNGQIFGEMALILIVRGPQDIYTIQLARRMQPSEKPPVIDEIFWKHRLAELRPIRFCTPVSGEGSPLTRCF